MRKSKVTLFSVALIIALVIAASSVKMGYGWRCILYAGCSDPGVVYKYDGTSWELISPELGYAVLCLVEYEGQLYAGTETEYRGAVGKVWRYDGGLDWTLVGDNMDHAVCDLAVYEGDLYAGTSGGGMKLYKYDVVSETWTQVIDPVVWYGTRALHVSHGYLLMGDMGYDLMGHWDGSAFYEDQPYYDGSCIYDYEDYGDYVYAAAYHGRMWQSPDATTWAVVLEYYDGNMWELEAFQSKLYISYGSGELRAYDGTGDLRGELVYTAPDGIISMTNCPDYLYFGTGGEAVSWYTGGAEETGTANVYRYDGSSVELIGEDMGVGVQDLYVTILPDHVIPEVPLGTIVASASMIIGLAAYVAIPRLRRVRG